MAGRGARQPAAGIGGSPGAAVGHSDVAVPLLGPMNGEPAPCDQLQLPLADLALGVGILHHELRDPIGEDVLVEDPPVGVGSASKLFLDCSIR